ncbi:hypothetical protein M6B38_349630 [Iris pallida]|uniref:Uncharacterized protein n=1 Tax=Iris pallida TaxID=29817 RepID=A0AAX6DPA4_IRIPA|nr:hypothetical protein M6B38_234885 [Iris pallida]KAJ6831360.1 hypothetical protein M6B38_349630 [Iris pallida]
MSLDVNGRFLAMEGTIQQLRYLGAGSLEPWLGILLESLFDYGLQLATCLLFCDNLWLFPVINQHADELKRINVEWWKLSTYVCCRLVAQLSANKLTIQPQMMKQALLRFILYATWSSLAP